MEDRIQKLGQILEKNSTWRWLGYGTLLGDGDSNQYAGLKIFMKYVLENRTSLIDQREDKGMNFDSSGTNPICRGFIKYLQTEGEEKKDAQLLLMANRAEAMMQMKDPSLGKMNDGIFLAHAFAFIGLGENANPRIEVTKDSIVGLLEKGLIESRKRPELVNVIDFAEGKTKKLDVPKPTAGAGAAPSGAVSEKAPGKPSGALSGGGGSAGGAVSYTHGASGTTVTSTKEEGAPEEALKQPEKVAGVEPAEGKKSTIAATATIAGGVDVGVEGKEGVVDDGMEEALLLQAAALGGGPASGKTVRKGGEKRVEGGQGRGEGKVNIPEGSKLQRAVVSTGKGKRKRVSKKRRIQQAAKDEALRERERQRVPQPQAPQPTQGQAGRKAPVPSGGWKYVKRGGKIAVGGGTGAGIIGWASSSGSEAVAATFSSTLAFIHTLF